MYFHAPCVLQTLVDLQENCILQLLGYIIKIKCLAYFFFSKSEKWPTHLCTCLNYSWCIRPPTTIWFDRCLLYSTVLSTTLAKKRSSKKRRLEWICSASLRYVPQLAISASGLLIFKCLTLCHQIFFLCCDNMCIVLNSYTMLHLIRVYTCILGNILVIINYLRCFPFAGSADLFVHMVVGRIAEYRR